MSLVPDAIDGLVAVFQRAVKSTTWASPWQISDGPPAATTKQALICVAFTGTTGEVAVEEVVDGAAAANPRRAQKTYEITSQVSRWAGNGSIKAQRDEVYKLVRAFETELLGDPTLGGAIQGRAWFHTARYAPTIDGGPVVVVEPIVRVQGFEA